jgi:hypothetical protein
LGKNWKDLASDIVGLIEKMAEIYAAYPREKLSSGSLTLQVVTNQIIEHDAENDFRLGHMGKERLARLGQLPLSLDVHEQAADWDAILGGEEDEDEDDELLCNLIAH